MQLFNDNAFEIRGSMVTNVAITAAVMLTLVTASSHSFPLKSTILFFCCCKFGKKLLRFLFRASRKPIFSATACFVNSLISRVLTRPQSFLVISPWWPRSPLLPLCVTRKENACVRVCVIMNNKAI